MPCILHHKALLQNMLMKLEIHREMIIIKLVGPFFCCIVGKIMEGDSKFRIEEDGLLCKEILYLCVHAEACVVFKSCVCDGKLLSNLNTLSKAAFDTALNAAV